MVGGIGEREKVMSVDHANVLPLAGELSRATADDLLGQVVSRLARDPDRPVVCDVARLVPAEPDALMVFPQALARVGGWPGASLALACASPELDRALLGQHVDRYLLVLHSLEDALHEADREVAGAVRSVALPAEAESPRTARQLLNDDWPEGQPGREAAAFVVHELCANALVHVGAPFTVHWAVTDHRVLVAVTDTSRQEPILRPVGPYSATSGRGIQLVRAMSRQWGVRWVYPGGKTVWADVDPTCFD
jgi:hypothetical protein